jgi:hypothetical protein
VGHGQNAVPQRNYVGAASRAAPRACLGSAGLPPPFKSALGHGLLTVPRRVSLGIARITS